MICLLSIIMLISILLIDSNMRIATTEYILRYPNLPDSFDGFRIAVLADVHDAEFGKENKRLIAQVQKANPNIIVIAGDLVNAYPNHRSAEQQHKAVETLMTGLAPIAPVYFITGNHEGVEMLGWPDTLLPILEKCGAKALLNECIAIESGGESIILAGTDDLQRSVDITKPSEYLQEIIKSERDSFVVVLDHRNNYLPFYSELGVDLVLSGHSHGGVVRLPFTDGLIGQDREWFPTYTNGVYTIENTNMLVSRGIGNPTGYPRFLNNPHIAVAVLKCSSTTSPTTDKPFFICP